MSGVQNLFLKKNSKNDVPFILEAIFFCLNSDPYYEYITS